MECYLLTVLREKKIDINKKIYGSVIEALDTIDSVLKEIGHASLDEVYLATYEEDDVFFKEFGE